MPSYSSKMMSLVLSSQFLVCATALNTTTLINASALSTSNTSVALSTTSTSNSTSQSAFQLKSSKRGLVHISDSATPIDDSIWTSSPSDLTWYYNYLETPSTVYESTSLAFIPMLWGAPSTTSDTSFLQSIKSQINNGSNITYVMSFNEPDGTSLTGGSDVDATTAAAVWKTNLEPLRKLNVSLGAPAVTGGSTGWTWLQEFFTACDGGCHPDFLPVHWYGSFDGLASHITEIFDVYPNMTVWVTEFALTNATLADTQSFFNQSCEYFDGLSNVTHYSYFGSFRSSVSNVGTNVAMLNSKGNLTDIGAWYLGRSATGVIPDVGNGTSTSSATPSKSSYVMPALVTTRSHANTLVGTPGAALLTTLFASAVGVSTFFTFNL